MVVNDFKIFLNMKNKGWLSPDKNFMKFGTMKMPQNKKLVLKMLG